MTLEPVDSELAVPSSAGTSVRAMGSASRWDNLSFYGRRALILVAISILASVVLRLLGFTGGTYSWFLMMPGGGDSWVPMGAAYAQVTSQNPDSLYEVFFRNHIKFQYPPSSLLLYSIFDLIGIPPTQKNLNVLVWLSVLATPAVIFRLTTAYIDIYYDTLKFSKSDRLLIASAFALSSLFFYPIMWVWRLGQVQAFLNLFFALSCLCWLSDRKLLSGALIGAICLFKPQFILFVLWGALRKQTGFLAGLLCVFGAGTLVTMMLYGFSNYLGYFKVLQFISAHGESFYANQSVNGLLNRALSLGYDQAWPYDRKFTPFAPYNFYVYVFTIASEIIMILYGIFLTRRPQESCSVFDYMTA